MGFLEMGVSIALFLLVTALLFYLVRYSNKRLLGIISGIEEKLSAQERTNRKNSRELLELKQVFEKKNQSRKNIQESEIEKKTITAVSKA